MFSDEVVTTIIQAIVTNRSSHTVIINIFPKELCFAVYIDFDFCYPLTVS